jgi:hypothetical protein
MLQPLPLPLVFRHNSRFRGLLVVQLLCACSCSYAPQCTGSSAHLISSDCSNWQAFATRPLYFSWLTNSSHQGHTIPHCKGSVTTDPCSCTFQDPVQCSKEGRITYLQMAGTGLPSAPGIPLPLLNLTGLTVFDLADNQLLGGTIPSQLSQLTALTLLQLAGSRLVGSIPPGLVQLRALTYLALDTNALTGVIPPFHFEQFTSCCAMNDLNFKCPLPANVDECNHCHGNPYPVPTCK